MSKKNPTSKNNTKELLKKAIKKEYGTIKKYAEHKGISEDAMYERLKYLSDNSLAEFRKDGIIIDNGSQTQGGDKSAVIGSSALKSKEGLTISENHYGEDAGGWREATVLLKEKVAKLESEITKLTEENERLKKKK